MVSTVTGVGILVSMFLTVAAIGGAALLTGRALALTWRPGWQVILSCLGLGAVDRFFVFALFNGPLTSVSGYVLDTLVILAIGMFSYRVFYVSAVIRQYPWLFVRTSPFSYKSR